MIDGLYGIADAAWGDPVELGSRLAAAGCRIVQLRAKSLSDDTLLAAGRALRPRLHAHGARLIVNDRVHIAVACGADGVHLGQDDGRLDAARRALPAGAIIGRSTHTVQQVEDAQDADYLGFGPVFMTATKDTGYADRGLSALAEAVAVSQIPIVAIGGINLARLQAVRETGAQGWAVISAILDAGDLERAARAFISG
ncbi:MAG: thiamine phosphate synthase [Myxococcota bacterium]|nr:thiamine phosphate synthase [Myxococcota bacterium]